MNRSTPRVRFMRSPTAPIVRTNQRAEARGDQGCSGSALQAPPRTAGPGATPPDGRLGARRTGKLAPGRGTAANA